MKLTLHTKKIKNNEFLDEGTIGTFNNIKKDINIFLNKFISKGQKFSYDKFLDAFTNTVTHETIHYLIDRNTTKRKNNSLSHIGEEGFVRHITEDISLNSAYFYMATYYKIKEHYGILMKFEKLKWKIMKNIMISYSCVIILYILIKILFNTFIK